MPAKKARKSDTSHINFIPRGEVGGDEEEGLASSMWSASGSLSPLIVEVSAGSTFIFEVCAYIHTLEEEIMHVKSLRATTREFKYPNTSREAGLVSNFLYEGMRRGDDFSTRQGFRRYVESLMLLDCDSRIFKEKYRDRKFPTAGDILRFKNDAMCDIGPGGIADVARRHPRLWMDYMVFVHVRDLHQQNLMSIYGLPRWFDDIDDAAVTRPCIFRCVASNEYCVVTVETQWDTIYVFQTIIEAFCWLRVHKLIADTQNLSSAESGEKLADAFAANLFDKVMMLKS